ncbi:MAG TPA: hypothetical protein ENI20_06105 [Bacteroides sp.]|nr:hypothetical protein [Bacteroides sp.]
MIEKGVKNESNTRVRTIKDIVNTPFKKAMFAIQILSYVLIVGSPIIGAAIGRLLGLKTSWTGGLILGIFITGEVLFYGSLAFLGKEIVMLVRDKLKRWFKRKNRKKSSDSV